MQSELRGYKWKPGRPRKNMDVVKRDLKDMEEAEVLAADRTEWRERVAQCIHQDVG